MNYLTVNLGNAHTNMAQGHTGGTLQPDGRIISEPTFDVQHVAGAIVHIANLPNDVTVLEYQILSVDVLFLSRIVFHIIFCRATGMPYIGRG